MILLGWCLSCQKRKIGHVGQWVLDSHGSGFPWFWISMVWWGAGEAVAVVCMSSDSDTKLLFRGHFWVARKGLVIDPK